MWPSGLPWIWFLLRDLVSWLWWLQTICLYFYIYIYFFHQSCCIWHCHKKTYLFLLIFMHTASFISTCCTCVPFVQMRVWLVVFFTQKVLPQIPNSSEWELHPKKAGLPVISFGTSQFSALQLIALTLGFNVYTLVNRMWFSLDLCSYSTHPTKGPNKGAMNFTGFVYIDLQKCISPVSCFARLGIFLIFTMHCSALLSKLMKPSLSNKVLAGSSNSVETSLHP